MLILRWYSLADGGCIGYQSLDGLLVATTTLDNCTFMYDGSPLVLFDKSNVLTGNTVQELDPNVRPRPIRH